MSWIMWIGAGAALGVTLRVLLPRTLALGLIVALAAGLLVSFVSPAAAAVSDLPFIVTPFASGLLVVGAVGRGHRVAHPRATPTVFVVAVVATLLATTALQNRGALSDALSWSTLALGAYSTIRNGGPAAVRVFQAGLVVIASAQSAAAVYELTTGSPQFWSFAFQLDNGMLVFPNPVFGDGVPRMAGSTGHPIALGMLVTIALVVLVARPALIRPRAVRIVVIVVLLGGEVASGTRNAFIALAIGAVFLALTDPRGGRFWKTTVLLGGGALALSQSGSVLSDAVDTLVGSGSYTNRIGSITAVPQLLTDRGVAEAVLGSGWGSESMLFARGFLNQNGFGIVDNQLVTTLAQSGVLGLAFLILLFLRAWRDGDRVARVALIIVFTMTFSFDFMRWHGIAVIVFAVFALGGRDPGEPVDALRGPRQLGARAPSMPSDPVLARTPEGDRP